MDRSKLSAEIIQEMGQLFIEALTRVAPDLVQGDLDVIEQGLQDMMRPVLGRVVEQVVAVIGESAVSETVRCLHCQRPMRLVDRARLRNLQGLVGDYRLRRAYYVCDGCHEGWAPLDERLGIGAGVLSPGLSRVACRLGIEDSFRDGADALQETLRIEVDGEAVRRIGEGIGQVAEAEVQAAMGKARAGAEPVVLGAPQPGALGLVVEVDGAMVHLEDDWHEMKAGVVASLGPQIRREEKSERVSLRLEAPSYCAGLEGAEQFWYRVYVEACRQGLGSRAVDLVVVLGDGAEWIWRHARGFLGLPRVEVVEILDIYHAFEHLWTVGKAVFGTSSPAATAWVELLKEGLVKQGANPVLAALSELTAADEAGREEVRKAIGYFTENASRMNYPAFIARQLPIGSGAVESTCKVLIEEREKGAGMRWSKTGAQAIATLRALHRSGRWRAFWQTHPQCRRPAVFPRERSPKASSDTPARKAA
jgi:hypothetical protein